MVSKAGNKPQPIVVISDYPQQRQRLVGILSPSVHYAHLPDMEEIKSWPGGTIVIMGYKPSAAGQMAKDIETIKKCHLGVFVMVIVKSGDKKTEGAAIAADSDEIIKQPFSDKHLLFVLQKLANCAKLHGTGIDQGRAYRPAGIDRLHEAVLGLLDENGQLRPFRDLERDIYAFASEHHQQNYEAVGRSLQIARTTWYRRAEKLNLRKMKDG